MNGYVPKHKGKANWKTVPVKHQPQERDKVELKQINKKYLGPGPYGGQRKQKRIKPRSRKMTKLMVYYNELKAKHLLKFPKCEVHPDFPADQIHHTRGRAGTLLIDVRFFKSVGMSGHCFINDEPNKARAAGLLCAKGDWNKAPEDAETARLKNLIQDLTHEDKKLR